MSIKQLQDILIDWCYSVATAILSVATWQSIIGWTIHTFGACISAVCVAVCVYFVMRKVKKIWP